MVAGAPQPIMDIQRRVTELGVGHQEVHGRIIARGSGVGRAQFVFKFEVVAHQCIIIFLVLQLALVLVLPLALALPLAVALIQV